MDLVKTDFHGINVHRCCSQMYVVSGVWSKDQGNSTQKFYPSIITRYNYGNFTSIGKQSSDDLWVLAHCGPV